MSLLFKRFFANLDESASRCLVYSERHFRLYGAMSLFLPAAYLVDVAIGNPSFDTLAMRTSAALVALPLLLGSKLTTRLKRCAPWYFVFVATYATVFVFGEMLILNAATTPMGLEIELVWVLQYFVSLFLFIQLIRGGLLATVLWVVASGVSFASLAFIPDPNWDEIKRVVLLPITGYITALFFGILTNRNIDYVNAEKLEAAAAVGNNIAHELRTPLASIRSLANGVQRHYDRLFNAFYSDSARNDTGLLECTLQDRRRFESLKNALTLIEKETEYANTIIDMLLLNTSSKRVSHYDRDIFRASSLLSEAVFRFPFNNSRERSSVTISQTEDFSIHGPRPLLLRYLQSSEERDIRGSISGSVEVR
ncbi:MAG: histidine kinase dimerization/phospho-acceptor domain-containing protein [Pseudomonadales bacterium]